MKIPSTSYQDITDRYVDGATMREIAHDYEVNASTIQRILKNLGIERRPTGRHGGKSRFPSTEADRLAMLKSTYGLVSDDIVAMWEKQGGRCPICKRAIARQYGAGNHVDHCHTTGNIRGLLCSRCNVGLGMFKDDVDMLRRAARYIEASVYASRQADGSLSVEAVRE